MSIASKIFYNTIIQTVGKVLALIIGIVTLSLLARYLGESGFGEYNTVLAYLGLFSVFADLGLYLIVTREISQPNEQTPNLISNAIGLRLAVSAIALTIGSAVALLSPYPPIVKQSMFIAIAALLFASLSQVLIGIFQKHLAMHLPALSELLGRGINLVLVFLFVQKLLPLPFFFISLACANAAAFLLTLLFARRFEQFSLKFNVSVWLNILGQSWPLGFAVILNLLYFKGDTVILSLLKNQSEVGVYSLPYKILEVLLTFPSMFLGLIIPLLSQYAFDNWPEFRQVLQKTFDALSIIVIPLIVGGLYFARPIISLVGGSDNFGDSPQVLQILVFAVAIIFFGTLFGYAVVAVRKEKTMVLGYGAGALTGLALYFALIPKYSYFGAAMGTAITELVVALAAFYLVARAMPEKLSFSVLIKLLFPTIILIAIFQYVSIFWVLQATLGVLLYFLAVMATGAVPWRFVRGLLRRQG